MSVTAKLSLTDFNPLDNGQAVFNIMTQKLDGLLHCKVRTHLRSDPEDITDGPNKGEVFILNSTGDGGWTGKSQHDLAIAKDTVVAADKDTWDSAVDWVFVTPQEGLVVYLRASGISSLYRFDGSSWSTLYIWSNLSGSTLTTTQTRINVFLDALRDHGVIAT